MVRASVGSLDTLDPCQALREYLPVSLRRCVQGIEGMLREGDDALLYSLSHTFGIQQYILSLSQGSLICCFQLIDL